MQLTGIIVSADYPLDQPEILLDIYQAVANMFSMST